MNSQASRLEDRISALPDGLIHRILCCLPTVEVVRTSLLSARWRDLWASMPRLDFIDCDFYQENCNDDVYEDAEGINRVRMDKFVQFVDKALELREPIDVQSFRLFWDSFVDKSKAKRWVEYALEHKVKEVELAVSDYWEGIHLPPGLFTSPFLRVLKIAFLCMDSPDLRLEVPEGAALRRLHTLHLTAIPRDTHDPAQVEALQRLLDGCPLLENLRLDWCAYYFFIVGRVDDRDVDIHWRGCSALESTHMKRCPRRVVRIHCPRLKWLATKGTPCGSVTFHIRAPELLSWQFADCCFKAAHEDLPALESANICVQLCFPDILRGVYNVTILTISCYFLKVVDNQPGPSRGTLTFHNLRKLSLRAVLDFHEVVLLLQRTPYLQVLQLENQNFYYGYRPREFKEEHWRACASLECLSHISTFSIHRFTGSRSEREFVKFLMTHAKFLNNVQVSTERNRFSNNHFAYWN